METRRWLNPSLPQTLQIAIILLYLDAAFLAFRGGVFSIFGVILVVGGVAAGFGIANERKWGYKLGVAMSLAPFLLRLLVGGVGAVFGVNIISLMFQIALVALLLHPQSREYQKVWFA